MSNLARKGGLAASISLILVGVTAITVGFAGRDTAYFAENVALFAMATGGVLLLVGIGFLVLTLRLRKPATAETRAARMSTATPVGG